MAISALASRLPDILEPATNPNHRGFFHSVVFFVALALLCVGVWKKLQSVGETGETQQIHTERTSFSVFVRRHFVRDPASVAR